MLRTVFTTLFLLASLATLPAQARMYQWVNGQTGRTQMSGKPPAWYRGDYAGPRVFVFENGHLIDDTARAVSLEERAALRAMAFAVSAREEAAAASAAATAKDATGDARSAAAKTGEDGQEPKSPLERGFGDDDDKANKTADEAPDATIARLKSIIDAWEDQQTEEAKRLLEQSAVLTPADPNASKPATSATATGTPPAVTP